MAHKLVLFSFHFAASSSTTFKLSLLITHQVVMGLEPTTCCYSQLVALASAIRRISLITIKVAATAT